MLTVSNSSPLLPAVSVLQKALNSRGKPQRPKSMVTITLLFRNSHSNLLQCIAAQQSSASTSMRAFGAPAKHGTRVDDATQHARIGVGCLCPATCAIAPCHARRPVQAHTTSAGGTNLGPVNRKGSTRKHLPPPGRVHSQCTPQTGG